jgi:hypothetical protein
MRIFEHPNMSNFECPICHTKADFSVVLVPIPGTEEDGNMKANQVHAEYYSLWEKMHKREVDLN